MVHAFLDCSPSDWESHMVSTVATLAVNESVKHRYFVIVGTTFVITEGGAKITNNTAKNLSHKIPKCLKLEFGINCKVSQM